MSEALFWYVRPLRRFWFGRVLIHFMLGRQLGCSATHSLRVAIVMARAD